MLMLMVMAMVMVQASVAAAKGFFKEHTLNGLSANAPESLREPSAADKADLFASSGEEAGGETDSFSRMGLLTPCAVLAPKASESMHLAKQGSSVLFSDSQPGPQ